VDVLVREDVADLADAVHLDAGLAHEREVVRTPWHEREVMPVRRARVVARLANERSRNDAADGVLAREDLARVAAGLVELFERHGLLVRRDLEDGVGRGVHDPLARLLMLLAELEDDVRPRRRLVPDHAAPGLVHERVDDVVREAVRIRRERLSGDDAHQLPVAGGRVLALRTLDQPAGDGGRTGLRRAALKGLDVAEAEGLHVGEIEAPDRLGDVAERVRALVPICPGIRQLSGTDGIEDDHARSWHGAILGLRCTPSSAYSLSSSSSPPSSAWRRGSHGSWCGSPRRRSRTPLRRARTVTLLVTPERAEGRPRAA